MYANQVATEAPDVLEYCWSQMATPEFGDGDGGGGGAVEVRLDDNGGDEEGVVDAEGIVVFEVVGDAVAVPDAPACISLTIPPRAEVSEAGKPVVLDCASPPDAADCISLTIPARAEVTEAGNAVEPDGNSIDVSGQEPSLFA